MSYDLAFVRKTAEQSWDEALQGDDDASAELPDHETWSAIVADARRVLGDVAMHPSGGSYAMEHEPSGIELHLYSNIATITVPYWYKGADAETVVRAMYDLGRIVERHTGLTGYDVQTESSLEEAAAHPELAMANFDDVAASFARRGISSPSNDRRPAA
ncbi:hypothetical protein ACPPVO_23680 [Dactylosporangium sp. McL0621]|uniref:hypothetical protein n=1 Tax=Dactylosporangium sp. McL0621 TaxID=3415678 RepID=UPI003CF15DBF